MHEVFSHNYHRYPAKFTPLLAEKIIQEESQSGDLICDFFGGCGTSLLAAKILGRESIGFDINPVAKLITDVKTTPISPRNLNKACHDLSNALNDNQPGIESRGFSIEHQRLKYWFSEESYAKLSFVYEHILACKNDAIQKFFLCAFSHCLKNASRWLMKSIKPTIDKSKKDIDIISLFIRHLGIMERKNKLLYEELEKAKILSRRSKLYLRDSLEAKIENNSIDLILTSPPYVVSYEYADLHQLSLLWLAEKRYKKWDKYTKDFNVFKSNFIGSSLARIPGGRLVFNSSIADEIHQRLQAIHPSLARGVGVYFHKMNKVFGKMHKTLKSGGKACIIIGNTKLRGVPVLNAEVALQQMLNIGFKRDGLIKRNAMTNKMITPFRDRKSGKFTSVTHPDKVITYHEEYILKLQK